MYLLNVIGRLEDFDPTQPVRIGPLTLGTEAAAEAASLLANPLETVAAHLFGHEFTQPVYWSIDHSVDGQIEVFGFPSNFEGPLPTAIEVGIIRALAALPPDRHSEVVVGGYEVVLGPEGSCTNFRNAAKAADRSLVGPVSLFATCSSVAIEYTNYSRSSVAWVCLVNSFKSAPLKFRYIELYRVIEAVFVAELKLKLLARFEVDPLGAVKEAQGSLASELQQIQSLADKHQDEFENIQTLLKSIDGKNQFATGIFRRMSEKNLLSRELWKNGAAIVYQIRCSIVHAGQIDLIFDKYPDSDHVIELILPVIECIALRLLGLSFEP